MSIVVMVSGRHPALGGGSATYVRAWGRAAIRAGYAPHIFCASTETRTETTPYGTVHSAQSPVRPFRGLMLAAHGPYIVRALETFAANHGTRMLIHSFGCWGGVGLAGARRLASRGIDCLTVVTPFTTAMHEGRAKLRGAAAAYGWRTTMQLCGELLRLRLSVVSSERRGLRGADAVLVNYDSVRRIVGAAFGNAIRFERITYSPETAFLRQADHAPIPDALRHLAPTDTPLILAVSSHNARKGLHVLLRALAQLRREGVRFRACLAGDGALLGRHRQLAATLGLGSCTILPGRVPDSFGYLRHADIFALPSLEEGSGSVSLLEAMQAGVAPVVSDIDGVPEDVSHGISALLVPPGDAGALAGALRTLVEDRDLRTRIAHGAHAQFQARFSAEAFVADVARAYRQLGFAPAARMRAA
jgi:glycosyltransferase involved in cell wall biosynthesis